MRNFINELTTAVVLTVAAVIGAVLWGTILHAAITHDAASPQPAPTTTSKVVPCLTYLSHGAMVASAETYIAPSPSFCVIPG